MTTEIAVERKPVFLVGKITNLRPLHKDDIPLLSKWINDPEVRQFILGMFPQTMTQEEAWLERLDKDERNIVFGIETKQGELIGVMGLHKIDWHWHFATTGAFIGNTAYWGKGFGTDAKMYLLDYAFNALGMRKIYSDVISYNKRSLRYSLHCGYKIEGTRVKHCFKRGKYQDLIDLAVFRKDWLPIWRKYKKTGSVR